MPVGYFVSGFYGSVAVRITEWQVISEAVFSYLAVILYKCVSA